jgi:hypothetical protein
MYINGCLELVGMDEYRVTANGCRISFGGDENVVLLIIEMAVSL